MATHHVWKASAFGGGSIIARFVGGRSIVPFSAGASLSGKRFLSLDRYDCADRPGFAKMLGRNRDTTPPQQRHARCASEAASGVLHVSISEASVEMGGVRVKWADGEADSFSLVWLRDHCSDAVSWDSLTHQKTVVTHLIPSTISAEQVLVTCGGAKLEVAWDVCIQGVSRSVYDAGWLKSHRHGSSDLDYVEPIVWGASEMQGQISSLAVPYEDVMGGDAGLLELLHMVRVYGVAFVSGTPHSKEQSQELVERIGPIQQTIYGGFWETILKSVDDADNIDSAYSTAALPAHSDGNYFEDPPGLQIFHCLQQDSKGGDTLLVDGFRAAQQVMRADPAAFDLLCRAKVAYQHQDPRNHIKARHTTIGLDPWGRLERIHYNNLDRDAVLLPRGEVDAFYHAWNLYTAKVRDAASSVWIKLTPGNLIVINNRRIMHGRGSFDGASGRRLVGCYISGSDFLAKHRLLSGRKAQGKLYGKL